MVIFILFTGHFLADFTFQSENLVQNKLNNFKYFIYHALIYASIFLIATFPFVKFEKAIFTYLVIISSHFLIDWIRRSSPK